MYFWGLLHVTSLSPPAQHLPLDHTIPPCHGGVNRSCQDWEKQLLKAWMGYCQATASLVRLAKDQKSVSVFEGMDPTLRSNEMENDL